MSAKPQPLANTLQGTALLLLLVLFGGVGRIEGQVYSRVPARDSELCTRCGAALTSEDVALIVRGRRISLCQADVGAVPEEPGENLLQQAAQGRPVSGGLFRTAGNGSRGHQSGLVFLRVAGSVLPVFWRPERLPRPVDGPAPVGALLYRLLLEPAGFSLRHLPSGRSGSQPGAQGAGQGSGDRSSCPLPRLRRGQPPHRPQVPGVRERAGSLATVRGDASLSRWGNESAGDYLRWH